MIAPSLAEFVAAWPLFEHAVYSAVVAGTLLGLMGVYVVLRRLVFLSAAVSQAAGLGVAGAFYLQIHWGLSAALVSPSLGSAVSTLTFVALIAYAWNRSSQRQRMDSLLGLGFLIGAAGTLVVGTRITQELHDIEGLLFGSAVAVVPEDFHALLGAGAALLALHLWLWSGFAAASFDREGAAVRGVPVRWLDGIFFASLALAISVSTRVLGVLPTFAFSVLPAMAAVRVVPNVHTALWVAALLGALSGAAGYLLAYMAELPVGPAQALVAASVVAAAELGRWVWRARRVYALKIR